MKNQHRFVLEAINPTTQCVARDVIFQVADLKDLCVQLQIDLNEFEPRAGYELSQSEVQGITQRFAVAFDSKGFSVRMRPSGLADNLPYKVHTNRELDLMLAGTKPLAAFVDDQPSGAESVVVPERLFDSYVKLGRFAKHEHMYRVFDRVGAERKFRRVLYAQPDQQWRIPAYLLLFETAEKCGWSEGFERMEGTLLGYEDWQNDAHIEMRRKAVSDTEAGQSHHRSIRE